MAKNGLSSARSKMIAAAAAAGVISCLAAEDYRYIISIPEGDCDPKVSAQSSGGNMDTRNVTADFSEGVDLTTTPFKGFYIHFR